MSQGSSERIAGLVMQHDVPKRKKERQGICSFPALLCFCIGHSQRLQNSVCAARSCASSCAREEKASLGFCAALCKGHKAYKRCEWIRFGDSTRNARDVPAAASQRRVLSPVSWNLVASTAHPQLQVQVSPTCAMHVIKFRGPPTIGCGVVCTTACSRTGVLSARTSLTKKLTEEHTAREERGTEDSVEPVSWRQVDALPAAQLREHAASLRSPSKKMGIARHVLSPTTRSGHRIRGTLCPRSAKFKAPSDVSCQFHPPSE